MMKRIIAGMVTSVCLLMMMTGVDFRKSENHGNNVKVKKNCFGYIIIEAGKGINCNGDTIALKKNFGYHELADNMERNTGDKNLR